MANDKAVKRSVLRVLGLSIITSGLYTFYWFYVTKNQLKQELKTNDNVGLQTVGLLVPILNAFIIYWLFRDFNQARASKKLETFPAGWYVGIPYILSGVAVVLLIGSILSTLGSVLDSDASGAATSAGVGVLGILLILAAGISYYVFWGVAISKLNQYWDKVGGTAAKFARGEIAVIVIGLIIGGYNATADRSTTDDSYDQEQLENQLQDALKDYDTTN